MVDSFDAHGEAKISAQKPTVGRKTSQPNCLTTSSSGLSVCQDCTATAAIAIPHSGLDPLQAAPTPCVNIPRRLGYTQSRMQALVIVELMHRTDRDGIAIANGKEIRSGGHIPKANGCRLTLEVFRIVDT